jgi:HlyD family secretion protein
MKLHLSNPRRLSVWILVVGAAGLALYKTLLDPIDVQTTRATRGTILVEAFGTGSVESRTTANVGFEIVGLVSAIRVDQGDRVLAGQELATIDNRTLRAEVALAEQQVALAESTSRRLSADISRSKAVLKAAEANLQRVEPLVDGGAVSGEVMDNALERHQVALADLDRAEAAELEGRQAIASAERQLDRVEAELDRTTARSPFDGVVIRRAREVGDVAVAGAAVLELAATDTIWARAWVDETYLAALRVGQPARLALRSESARELVGHVSRIGREVDRETRELLVDVAFDDPPESLVFGQRVDLWIELDRHIDVIRVPRAFVVRNGRTYEVFVAADGRAVRRPVELGLLGREFAEVLSGLSESDLVIDPNLDGRRRLDDGDRIRAVEDHSSKERE